MNNKAIIALVGAVSALNVQPAVPTDQYLSQVDVEADAEFFDLLAKAFGDFGSAVEEVFTTGDFEKAGHIIANTQPKEEEKQRTVDRSSAVIEYNVTPPPLTNAEFRLHKIRERIKSKKTEWEAYHRALKAQIERERPAKERGIRAKAGACKSKYRPDPPVGTEFTSGGKTYKNVTAYRNATGNAARVRAFYKTMINHATTAEECEKEDCLNDCYGPNYQNLANPCYKCWFQGGQFKPEDEVAVDYTNKFLIDSCSKCTLEVEDWPPTLLTFKDWCRTNGCVGDWHEYAQHYGNP